MYVDPINSVLTVSQTRSAVYTTPPSFFGYPQPQQTNEPDVVGMARSVLVLLSATGIANAIAAVFVGTTYPEKQMTLEEVAGIATGILYKFT